jgi:hypothetical protein
MSADQVYDARIDYYKQLREFIPKNHRRSGSADDLLRFAAASDARKSANYLSRAGAYSRWWGDRSARWLGGGGSMWEAAGIEVPVGAEVIASFDGVRHYVKLYFKKARLSADRANVTLRLLQIAYSDRPHGTFVVLDLAHEEAYEATENLDSLDLYLAGEAASFRVMAS